MPTWSTRARRPSSRPSRWSPIFAPEIRAALPEDAVVTLDTGNACLQTALGEALRARAPCVIHVAIDPAALSTLRKDLFEPAG